MHAVFDLTKRKPLSGHQVILVDHAGQRSSTVEENTIHHSGLQWLQSEYRHIPACLAPQLQSGTAHKAGCDGGRES